MSKRGQTDVKLTTYAFLGKRLPERDTTTYCVFVDYVESISLPPPEKKYLRFFLQSQEFEVKTRSKRGQIDQHIPFFSERFLNQTKTM